MSDSIRGKPEKLEDGRHRAHTRTRTRRTVNFVNLRRRDHLRFRRRHCEHSRTFEVVLAKLRGVQ
jgi:hypothetical protein